MSGKFIEERMMTAVHQMQEAHSISAIEEIYSELLAEYGYETSGTIPIVTADELNLNDLSLQNRENAAWLSKHVTQEALPLEQKQQENFHARYAFSWKKLLENIDTSAFAKRISEKVSSFYAGKNGFIAPVHSPNGAVDVIAFYGDDVDVSDEIVRTLGAVAHFYHAAIEQLNAFANTEEQTNLYDCLKYITLGKSDMEIAYLLGISEQEVNRQISRIINGLEVSTREQAIAEAAKRNLISL